MADDDFSKPSFSAGRKFAIGLNALVAVAAALAIAVMLNYLAARHYVRRDLDSRHAQLSPQTERVLRSLTNDVRVTVFFDARDQQELNDLTTALLREYTYLTPHIIFKVIDPTRDPTKAELLLARYKLTGLKNKNFVIFDCAGRTKVIYENELSDYDVNSFVQGKSQEFHRTAFRGEMLFTTAIFNLANPRRFKIYFLDGHGEHDPDKADHPHGYAKFADILREEVNASLEKVSLLGTNDVPADCSLLVIAGPTLPFSDDELEKLSRFMKQGGRMFVLMGNMAYSGGRKTGLEKMLAQFGVGVAENMVFDPKYQITTAGDLFTAQLSREHPVTKALLADTDDLRIRLVLPRAVGKSTTATTSPDAPKVEILAAASEEATESSEIRDGVPYRNQFTDKQGAFPLIVAAEQGNVKGVTTERGAMRLIVVGDSLCLDNELIDTAPGNHAFAALAVNWLLDRPPILLQGLLPHPLKEYHMVMSRRQQRITGIILLAGMPAAVLFLGALVWWRRRT